ncbi:MAG: heparin lyase I family protein [Hahellaceae bacterium]|nr:heparin lyase I family protein [Hahellaceae bacterium]
MTILYSNNFETALNATASGNSPVLSTDHALSVTKSMKSVVDYNDANMPYRTEITGLSLGGGSQKMSIGGTYWLGFALYVPSVYPASTQGDIFYQVHGTNDTGEASLNPPLSLQIANDKWKWTMVSDNNVITTKGNYAVSRSGFLGNVIKGAWTRFVVQFKIAPGGSGFIRIWLNDTQVVDYTGATFFNDAQGPYNKFGIYRPAWKPGNESWGVIPSELAVFTTRTLYHDDIKVGDSAAVYADVAPSGGGTPVTGAAITSINGTNEIAANTAVNAVVGTELTGVFAAAVKDADTTINGQGIGFPSGTQASFSTDTLTGISTPATIELSYAAPAVYKTDPRTWGDNCAAADLLEADYTTAIGPFTAGRTLTQNAAKNWTRSHIDTGFAVTSGDVLDVWFYCVSGTGGQGLFGTVIGAAGTENTKMDYAGSLSGTLSNISATGGSANSCAVETSTIYPTMKIVKLRYTAGASGNLWLGMGPRSTTNGDSIHQLGVRVWKNRDAAAKTVSATVDIPSLLPAGNSAPTISSVPTLTRGQSATITGTGHKAVTRIQLTNGTTTVDVDDFVSASDGTSTTFTVPLTAPTNSNQIILHWAPRANFDNAPLSWGDNAGGVLTKEAYPTSVWASAAGATLLSVGSNWHRSSVSAITAIENQTVTVDFFYLLGSSNKAQFSIRNQTAAANIVAEIASGVAEITLLGFGSQATVNVSTINGISRCRITFVNSITGELLVGLGPLSTGDGDSIHEFAYRAFTDGGAATVTNAVTMSGTYVPTKKIILSDSEGTALYARSASAGVATLYNSDPSGNVDILIGSGNPRINPGDSFPTVLAYASNLAVVDGQLTITESDLSYGSINSLQTGAQGYYLWGANADKSVRWSAPIEIVQE